MAEENKPSLQTMVEQTTIADVYQAAKHLNGVAKKTRLIESPFFSEISGIRSISSLKISRIPVPSSCVVPTTRSASSRPRNRKRA